jgi:thioredoxin reductase
MRQDARPVVIIGAGPVGLAAAAQLLARGASPVVLEAGSEVAANVRQWGHVRMFTPWRFCVDRAAAGLLATRGWVHPPADDVPTGAALVTDYLEPLAAALGSRVRFDARVIAVSRRHTDKVRSAGRDNLPFVVRVATTDGSVQIIEAQAVIDASGTWCTPNPAGADGLPALGEADAADGIVYGIPDVLGEAGARYGGKTVAVIGSGHSALNSLIELATLQREAPGTRIFWLTRKDRIEAAFGGEAADALPERGALGSDARALVESGAVEVMTSFHLDSIQHAGNGGMTLSGSHAEASMTIAVDELIVATGFRPDLAMLREIRLDLDPWLECAAALGPLIDPNVHSCGTVRPHGAKELAHPEAGFFIAGIKSYGRAPTFLLATGYEQVRSIAAYLVGDFEGAARVELDLPETGVCSARPVVRGAVTGGEACCTPETPQGVCCGPKPELQVAASCCGNASRDEKPTAATTSLTAGVLAFQGLTHE